MSHPDFLTDDAHVLLSGATGSATAAGGKTSTANWWADQLVAEGHVEYAVAFDPKGGNFEGSYVRDAGAAAAAVQDGARRLDWHPDPRGDLADQHDAAVRFAVGLAGDVVMVHDDAVLYADADSLAFATALAGNPGPGDDPLKSLVVSQDPWDLPRKAVRANLNNIGWVGPATDMAERYFETMGQEHVFSEIEQRHTDPFMWSVYDGVDLWTFNPVPKEYAR